MSKSKPGRTAVRAYVGAEFASYFNAHYKDRRSAFRSVSGGGARLLARELRKSRMYRVAVLMATEGMPLGAAMRQVWANSSDRVPAEAEIRGEVERYLAGFASVAPAAMSAAIRANLARSAGHAPGLPPAVPVAPTWRGWVHPYIPPR